MQLIGFHRAAEADLEACDEKLRAKCKAHLDRLRLSRPGVSSGISVEKISGTDLFELKIKHDKQEFRFLFFYLDGGKIVVAFFQKKTRKTPMHEIELATGRMKDVILDRSTVNNGIH